MFSTRREFMGGADGAINKYRRSSHSGEESDRGCSNVRYQVLSAAVLKVQLLQVGLLLSAEPGARFRDSSRFPRRRPFIFSNRHTPSGQSRVYRVTQLRTDAVHSGEVADKVEVAPGVTAASLRRFRAALIGPTQGLPKRRRLCR